MCMSFRTGEKEETCSFLAVVPDLVENKSFAALFKRRFLDRPPPNSLSRGRVGPRNPSAGLVVRGPSDLFCPSCEVRFVDSPAVWFIDVSTGTPYKGFESTASEILERNQSVHSSLIQGIELR